MIVSKKQKPPPHPFYGDSYERGLDPWHSNAFPDEFKSAIGKKGKRKGGWFLLDGYKNSIGFIVDGTEFEDKKNE